MNHTGDKASDKGRDRLFVCLLPRLLVGICEPCGSATLPRGFGMGKLGDPCWDLRAELRPQGGVGLGRWSCGTRKGNFCWLETPIAPESSRMEAVGTSGSRSRGCCDTPAPRTLNKGCWRIDPTGNDSWTIKKHPWLQQLRQKEPNCFPVPFWR